MDQGDLLHTHGNHRFVDFQTQLRNTCKVILGICAAASCKGSTMDEHQHWEPGTGLESWDSDIQGQAFGIGLGILAERKGMLN